jgi:hypothetical protein
VADESLLREILQSPLDDLPQHRGREFMRYVWIAVVVLVLGAGLVWLRSGGEAAEPATEVDPGVSTSVTAEAGAGDSTTTTVPEIAPFPEQSVFHEMVALGDGTVLLFGGLIPLDGNDTRPLLGTWRFDATSGEWSVAESESVPSARFGHAMSLHPPTGTVVLFGGGTTVPRPCPRTRLCTGPEDNQIWHFDPDGETWQNMTPAVTDDASWPAPRFGARLVYEPVTERFVMFGGVGVFGDAFTPTFYEDTWAYDPIANEWEDLTGEAAPRPIGRTTHGMVWNEDAQRIVMFAGDSLSGLDDDHLWTFDPSMGVWEDRGFDEMGPRDRWFHLFTTDPQSGRVVLIGGSGSVFTPIQGGTIREVAALYEVWTWSEAEGWVALNRYDEALSPVSGVADPATLALIVFDGHDVLSYDVAVDSWTVLAERPEEETE